MYPSRKEIVKRITEKFLKNKKQDKDGNYILTKEEIENMIYSGFQDGICYASDQS